MSVSIILLSCPTARRKADVNGPRGDLGTGLLKALQGIQSVAKIGSCCPVWRELCGKHAPGAKTGLAVS